MRTFSLIVTVVLLSVQCNSQSDIDGKNDVVEIKVNSEITFQTIENFGASDAWSCHHTNGTLFLFFHPCIVTLQLFYKFARLLASLAQW